MREVRPTIRVIKSLPRETFGDATVWEQVRQQDWANLDLYGIDHPLLNDARARFTTGSQKTHTSHTNFAGQPVYEVRDRTGAAWRGGIVLDNEGDPWLVYVDRHDRFNANGNSFFRDTNYLPSPAEYRLREREEAAASFITWRVDLLRHLIDAITQAARLNQTVTTTVAGHRDSDEATFEVSLDHDAPAPSASQAHESESLVTLVLRMRTKTSDEFRQEVLNTVLPFLQPDLTQCDSVYGRDGSMTHLIPLTQAKLIQIAADATEQRPPTPAESLAPTHLHYTGKDALTVGLVEGTPVRGVCGVWFVPTRDEHVNLPLCPQCDEDWPVAQLVLQWIDGSASSEPGSI